MTMDHRHPAPATVIPAKAGIQAEFEPRTATEWTPAFAGVTGRI